MYSATIQTKKRKSSNKFVLNTKQQQEEKEEIKQKAMFQIFSIQTYYALHLSREGFQYLFKFDRFRFICDSMNIRINKTVFIIHLGFLTYIRLRNA